MMKRWWSALCLCGAWLQAEQVEWRNANVGVVFDTASGVVRRIDVSDRERQFQKICDRVQLEMRTAMPGVPAEVLTIDKLLAQAVNADATEYRYEYAIAGKPDWRLVYTFRVGDRILTWDAKVENPGSELTGLQLSYCFENLYVAERREFNTNNLTPNGLPQLTYRADYIGEFPMTAVLDEQADIGLTVNATFGVMRPLFSIEYDKLAPQRSLEFRNALIGAGDGISAQVSIDLFGHVGDWRPGMGLIYEHYRPYFTTENQAIRKHEGNFLCAWYFLGFTDQQLDDLIRLLGVTNCEVMFYNPYYGLYAPAVGEDEPWTILMREHEKLEDFQADPIRQTTYRQINETVARMRRHGVGSFIYFNYIDGSRAMPDLKARFGDQIFINAENRMGRGEVGAESLANDNMYVMQMEPGTPWGNYMEEQARQLLARVPDCDGYFIDMANGYGVFDRNHSDGVTVIDGRKAYCDVIGIERMQRYLTENVWRPAGKGTWANGPKFPEISRYCDALIAEIPGWTVPERDPGVPLVSFLCLDKPFVYMLAAWRADNAPPRTQDIERHIKYGLLYGGFLDAFVPMDGPEKLSMFAAYRPLTEALAGKRWVFDAYPLTLPAPLYGNIFTYDHGGYTVYLFDHDDSLLAPPAEVHENVTVSIRVTGMASLRKVIFTGVDAPEQPVELTIERTPDALTVQIPRFSVAGMLQFLP